ncbi:MAG TPA: hypothetical protein VKZ51_11920 [Cyclobacteriaceae bacterium]|nr:hypothetical protein [Cyclobacteriaceae bacterium]
MQELLELPLDQPLQDIDIQSVISILEKAIVAQQTTLGMMLSYLYRDQGGVVENVHQVGEIKFETPTSGSIRVAFDVVVFNACWDTHGTDPEIMILHFNLDEDAGSVKLYSPSWPERGQDEI